jgi:nucleoside-diphosphate-sugar epimerase
MPTPLPGAPPQILIVGCGYTGLRAARFWLQAGYSVAAITRSTARAAELQQQGLQTIVTDLAADSPVPQLPDCPIIVWSAGYDRSSGCTRRQLWIHGLEKLLRSLPDRGQPRRVLLTSTTVAAPWTKVPRHNLSRKAASSVLKPNNCCSPGANSTITPP